MTIILALQPHRHPYQFGLGIGLLALALPLLIGPAYPPLLPPDGLRHWQSAADLSTLVLALLIFITGYRAILSPRKGAVVWLGIAFLGVGLLAFLHLMQHMEAPALAEAGAAALWLEQAPRLVAAAALLVYALLPAVADVTVLRKRLAVALTVLLVLLAGLLAWLHPQLLPPLRAADGSPTALQYALHGTIMALHLASLQMFWQRRATLGQECLMALIFTAALCAVAEILFARAHEPALAHGQAAAHFYLIAGYLFLFHATFNEALRRPLERLKMLHERENATLTAAPDGVIWVDDNGNITLANPAMQTLSGYAPHELVGQNVALFLPPHLRERHAQSIRQFFHSPHSRAMGVMDLKLHRKDGHLKPVDISLGYWEIDGQAHAIAYLRDLSERKKLEETLRHQATHDELTGLPNRWLLQLQLKQALAHAERAERRVAVLFVDLDHFKSVNDSFGHAAGDALLVQASRRIQGLLRASDTLARMGGDEFAILLSDIQHPDEAVSVALKVLACLQEPFDLSSQQVYSGASIGLSYYPDDARDLDSLLRYADMAMYQAKQDGRGAYACYSQEMDQRTHEDMQLHSRLKAALHDRLLQLHFQPQVELETGRLLGAEALLRWHDPLLGQVPPGRFIPIAETTGLILPLADWVLETACQQIAAWQRAGTPVRLAVNISSQQLRQGQLAEKVRSLLERTGAQARWLELEITETAAMTQPRQALEQLDALMALGCSISLDDFGTGYSSFAYLKALPISKIKIDQSFVRDLTEDSNDAVIVQTIVGMARNLGLDVVAEGVETEAQRRQLILYGCHSCQGYLFHRPLPLHEFEPLLRRQRHRAQNHQKQEENA